MTESRGELLAWVNDISKLNLAKIEELGKGAAHCLVLDSIYGDVPIAKVKFDATQEFHFVNNFKLLQQAFTKHKIDKVIPVDRLVKCKFQDNLEFLQWMKKYWEQHISPDREYDAVSRRGIVQTPMAAPVRKIPSAASSKANTVPKKPTPRTIAPTRVASTPQRNTVVPAQRSASTHSFRSESVSEEVPSVSDLERQAWVSREAQLIATCQAMTEEVTQLRVAVDTMEKERDFYFNRLREIEIVVQEKLELIDSNPDAAKSLSVPGLLTSLQKVLYSDDVPVQAVILPSPSQVIEESLDVNISDETPPLIISSPVMAPLASSPSRKPTYASFSPNLSKSPKSVHASPGTSPRNTLGLSKTPVLDKKVSLWTLDDADKLPTLPSQASQSSLVEQRMDLMNDDEVF